MSEDTSNGQLTEEQQLAEEELQSLKLKATNLGIKFGGNIGPATLRKKINAHMADLEPDPEPVPVVAPVAVPETEAQKRARITREKTRLVRVIVTSKDPSKRELNGEWVIVGNSYLPTIRRYVPFDNDAGWHIEQAVLDVLQDRVFQNFKSEKLPNGMQVRKGFTQKAYHIEILPDLTQEELDTLAAAQTARNSID